MKRLVLKPYVRMGAGVLLSSLAASARSQTLLHEYQNLGFWIADAKDVDGDGHGDLLISSPFQNVGGVPFTGIARVFSGRTGALLHTLPAFSPGSEMGWSISGLGDVNDDGKSEFLVAARFASPGGLFQAGEVYVFDGATGSAIHTFAGEFYDGRLGHGIHGGGELDGDGKPDILIGETTASPNGMNGAGRLLAYSGEDFGLLFDIPGEFMGDWFANDLASFGDVTGDGLDEFVVGAPLHEENLPLGSNVGRVYVYSPEGPTLLQTLDGAAPGELLGATVAAGGDVNGDGVPDFLAGTPFADPGGVADAGILRAISGLDYSTILDLAGEGVNDQFGYSAAGGGDADGDGRADILVGAVNVDSGGLSNAGRGYLFSGRTGAILHQSDGVIPGGQYAKKVALLGPVNCGATRDYAFGGGHTRVFSLAQDCVGPGCPGTPPYAPPFGKRGEPVLGNLAFGITTRTGVPFLPAVLLLGLSDRLFGGLTLPVGLAGLGLPSCFLRVSADVSFVRFADLLGEAVADVPIPNDPGLVSIVLYGQWLVFDPGSSNASFTVSDAGRLTVNAP